MSGHGERVQRVGGCQVRSPEAEEGHPPPVRRTDSLGVGGEGPLLPPPPPPHPPLPPAAPLPPLAHGPLGRPSEETLVCQPFVLYLSELLKIFFPQTFLSSHSKNTAGRFRES